MYNNSLTNYIPQNNVCFVKCNCSSVLFLRVISIEVDDHYDKVFPVVDLYEIMSISTGPIPYVPQPMFSSLFLYHAFVRFFLYNELKLFVLFVSHYVSEVCGFLN